MEKNELIATLDGGLEVWKLVISNLKEADLNAQVMDERKMKILTSNIRNRGALESLPYVYKQGDKFTIVSGHHRVKAASGAGMKMIYGLVDTTPLTESQIVSKQIAHNELVGTHDSEILGELIKQMKDADDLIASGLTDKYINSLQEKAPVMDLPQLDFDWRSIQFQFLPEHLNDFETLVHCVESKTNFVGVAPLAQFDEFVEAMNKFGRTKNIKSIGTTIQFLTKIALKEVEKWQENQNTTENTTSNG